MMSIPPLTIISFTGFGEAGIKCQVGLVSGWRQPRKRLHRGSLVRVEMCKQVAHGVWRKPKNQPARLSTCLRQAHVQCHGTYGPEACLPDQERGKFRARKQVPGEIMQEQGQQKLQPQKESLICLRNLGCAP